MEVRRVCDYGDIDRNFADLLLEGDPLAGFRQAISSGLLAVDAPRTPEITTKTGIGEFAGCFARADCLA